MLNPLDRVTRSTLQRLHRGTIGDPTRIRAIFEGLRDDSVPLRSGINRHNDPRLAFIKELNGLAVTLSTHGLDQATGDEIYLNFAWEEENYFFAARINQHLAKHQIAIDLPDTLFRVERRDQFRSPLQGTDLGGVELKVRDDLSVFGRAINSSPYGLGIDVPERSAQLLSERVTVAFTDSVGRSRSELARVRHKARSRPGWIRVGVSLSCEAQGAPLRVDRRDRILERGASRLARERLGFLARVVGSAPSRFARKIGIEIEPSAPISVVEYKNNEGQIIRAIEDCFGDKDGATAVVIPPAWGRTKETLLPLAETILSTFRAARQPVRIIRFDGTNRRGESFIDPSCRAPGREYLRFRFSQAVSDIEATVDHLFDQEVSRPGKVILVTFSLASIEGRRAIARNLAGRLSGWVSTVGMVDLQSALKTISGGIDYGYGLLQGVSFGTHELVGVLADMDYTGTDAISHRLAFLEEARADMARIKVPISWIHGRHDAWMDIERVRDAMGSGNPGNRRLIEVPTGHQLRASRDAIATFQLIAEEVSEMALGSRLTGRLPGFRRLASREAAERARRPRRKIDLKLFWADYLLGRDRRFGMQLVTSTAAYRNFMNKQILRLELKEGDCVADLGAGTGDFPVRLSERLGDATRVKVHEVDHILGALQRGRDRSIGHGASDMAINPVLADLEIGSARSVPFASETFDAALASLLISYLPEPERLLFEVRRILRPGGRFVVSCLRKDADISKIYADGMKEFSSRAAREQLVGDHANDFDELARNFLNDASRILDLEEDGRFQFWEIDELTQMLRHAGFVDVRSEPEFGDPPQAFVVRARRP